MPYRTPDPTRMYPQLQQIMQYAGATATWRDMMSGATGISVAGMGITYYYREQTITALFKPVPLAPEEQSPAGALVPDTFQVTTKEPIERQDQLRWKGNIYRVESDPSPAALPDTWQFIVKRGQQP